MTTVPTLIGKSAINPVVRVKLPNYILRTRTHTQPWITGHYITPQCIYFSDSISNAAPPAWQPHHLNFEHYCKLAILITPVSSVLNPDAIHKHELSGQQFQCYSECSNFTKEGVLLSRAIKLMPFPVGTLTLHFLLQQLTCGTHLSVARAIVEPRDAPWSLKCQPPVKIKRREIVRDKYSRNKERENKLLTLIWR